MCERTLRLFSSALIAAISCVIRNFEAARLARSSFESANSDANSDAISFVASTCEAGAKMPTVSASARRIFTGRRDSA